MTEISCETFFKDLEEVGLIVPGESSEVDPILGTTRTRLVVGLSGGSVLLN